MAMSNPTPKPKRAGPMMVRFLEDAAEAGLEHLHTGTGMGGWWSRRGYICTYKRLPLVLMLSELERPKPAIVVIQHVIPSLHSTIRRACPLSVDLVGVVQTAAAAAAAMSGTGCELFPSWNEVVARREWEVSFALERLEKGEVVDLPLCKIERVSSA